MLVKSTQSVIFATGRNQFSLRWFKTETKNETQLLRQRTSNTGSSVDLILIHLERGRYLQSSTRHYHKL